MANEFKIRKGLIVEGASGGVVVNVLGSQGQLLSVTDDLSGSIFAVSDISGVPIFDVNSSGNSYFDGEVSLKSRLNLQRSSSGATTLIQFKNEIGADRAHIDFGGTNEELSFFAGDGTTENMTINSAGNAIFNGKVGIGLITPTGNLSMNSQIDNGTNPPGAYTTNTAATRYQSFFNSYYNYATDGLGPYPRFFDMVATGSPDGTNGGSNIRFFTTGIVAATGAVERMRITSAGNSLFNYTNPTIQSYGSGAYGGKVVIKASDDQALTLLNSSIGGTAHVALNFTNEFVANQYNYLARIKAEPETVWDGTASNRSSRLTFSTNNAGTIGEKMRITSAGGISFGSTGTAYGTSGQVLTSAGNASPTWQDNGSGDISGTGTPAYVAAFTGNKTIASGPIVFSSNSFELLQSGTFMNSNHALYNGTSSGGTGTTAVQYIKIFDKDGNGGQQYLHFSLLSFSNSEYSAEVKIIIPAYSGFSSSYGTMDAGQGVQVEIVYGGLSGQTSSILSIIECADLSSTSTNTDLYLKIQPVANTTQVMVRDYGDCTTRVLTNQTWSTTAPSNQHREFTFNVGATNINEVLSIHRDQKVGIGTASPNAKLDVKNNDGNASGLHIVADFNQNGGSGAQMILGYYADGTSPVGPVVYAANGMPQLINASGGIHFSNDLNFSSSFLYTFRDGVGINNPNSVSATPNVGYTMCVGRSHDSSSGVSGSISAVGTIRASAFTTGINTTAGIGGSNGDVNAAEVGPGYINLSRDDTAAAQQIRFEKNGALHSYIETTTSGLNIGNANVYLAKAANQGQLFFGTADNQYEIFGGGTWGYMGYNTSGYHRFFGSGTERMRITNAGNVGINVTGPSKKLEVAGSFKLGTNAYIEYGGVYPYTTTTANTAAVGNLVFSAGLGSAAYESKIDLQGTNTAGVAGITLSTASTARMVVTADGNVGVGTTTPLALLDIQGTQGQLFSVTDDLSGSIFAVADISGVPIFDINSSGVSYFDGKVGIGVTSPTAKLQVAGTTTYNSDTIQALRVCDATDVSKGIHIGFDTVQNAGIIQAGDFGVSYRNLSLNPNGANVGIGITGPTAKLHLFTSGSEPINLGIQNSERYYKIETDGGFLTFNDVSAGGTARMVIDSSGDVGIGTTGPDVKLALEETPATIVSGNAINGSTMKGIKIRTNLNGDESVGLWFGTNGSHWSGISGQRKNASSTWGTTLSFYTHENYARDLTYTRERMIIDSEGNVGIGITEPQGLLHVRKDQASETKAIIQNNTGAGAGVRLELSVGEPASDDPVVSFNVGNGGADWSMGVDNSDADKFKISGGTDSHNPNLGANNKLAITTGGNVGIGNTSPDKLLHVGDGAAQLGSPQGAEIEGYNNTLDLKTNEANSIADFTAALNLFCDGVVGSSGTGTGIYFRAKTGGGGGGEYTKGRIQGAVYTSWTTNTDATRTSKLVIQTTNSGTHADRITILGTGATTFVSTVTATNFILSSDKTLKENIKDISNKHIDVSWKSFELKSEPGVKRSGVIAQELETKHPEFVRTNEDGLKSVAYIDLLIAKIAELEARLEKAGL